jgi:hypothetical protein
MGRPSAFPTQTPVTNCGTYPTVQLSRQSDEVPVLTAAGRDRLRTLPVPKAGARARSSERMSVMM